ncbi:MAG: hypothetical protein ABFS21_03775 [Actinomycetota bacterium]
MSTGPHFDRGRLLVEEDRITIDPEFDPNRDRKPQAPWPVVGALLVALGLFGWMLSSPISTGEGEAGMAASADTGDTVATTTAAAASTSSTLTPAASAARRETLAELPQPLAEVIPGFADEITMLATPSESFKVIRWYPSMDSTTVVLALDRGEAGWGSGVPLGLDATGDWFAEMLDGDLLVVHPVPGGFDEPVVSEIVGLSVQSVVWHDKEPGSLAWASCPRSESGAATVFTLEASDPVAEPVPVQTFDDQCGVWAEGVPLEGFGDDGLRIGAGEDVAGSVVLEASEERDLVSPDGSLSVLIGSGPWNSPTFPLSVVEVEIGETVMVANELGSEVLAAVWSTDGRFLMYEPWNFETETGALVIYDTITNTTTRVPLSEIIDEIRTSESR